MSSKPEVKHATPSFRTFCGDKALKALPRELDRLGASRVVVFVDPAVLRYKAAFDRVTDAIGERLAAVFDGVREHSPIPSVEEGCAILKQSRAEALIAVGGGSTVVTARASTILLAENKDVRELCTRRNADGRLESPKLLAPKLPHWVIPTTPITAYAKVGSAIRDPETGDRLALFDPKTRAQGIFLDPELALTAPERLAQTSALNAFNMAIEALQSNFDDPLAEALLSHALRMLNKWLLLLREAPDDAEPRLRLMLAALLCGQGTDYASGGLAQSLAHAAGPRSNAANGVVEAILLPHSIRYNAPVTDTGLVRVAEALDFPGSGDVGPPLERCVAAVGRIFGELELPTRLRDVGVSQADLAEVAEHAMQDWWLTNSPRRPGPEDLEHMLQEAW